MLQRFLAATLLTLGLVSLAQAQLGFGQNKRENSAAKIQVKAIPGPKSAGGQQKVTLSIKIDKGWKIYANPVGNELLAESVTKVDLDKDAPATLVQVAYPKGQLVKDKAVGDYRIYKPNVGIVATIRRTGNGPITFVIQVNACDQGSCLPPGEKRVTIR